MAGRYELVIGGIPVSVDATAAQVRIRRELVPFQRPDATLSTDEATLRAVCFGQRSVPDAVSEGDLRMIGSADAVDRLTALLLTLVTRRPR